MAAEEYSQSEKNLKRYWVVIIQTGRDDLNGTTVNSVGIRSLRRSEMVMPRKQDELDMMELLYEDTEGYGPKSGSLLYYETPIKKRKTSILEKWSDKGLWEYGVSLRAGWLTKKGWEWLQKEVEND